MTRRKIVIDGKSYHNVDEMPEDVRRSYEQAMSRLGSPPAIGMDPIEVLKNAFADTNNNGVPDLMENQHVINISAGTKFVVDGTTYDSVDELPAEARARYEQAMGSMDKNRNGVPDFLEGMINNPGHPRQPGTSSMHQVQEAQRRSSSPLMSASPSITPDTSNGWMLALAALALLFLCAAGAAGVWYFFLR